jgi:hypothetical protein
VKTVPRIISKGGRSALAMNAAVAELLEQEMEWNRTGHTTGVTASIDRIYAALQEHPTFRRKYASPAASGVRR